MTIFLHFKWITFKNGISITKHFKCTAFKTWLFYHKTFRMYHISNMTVVFVRLCEIVSSYMKIGICQLINSCSLCEWAEETRTANAAFCCFLPCVEWGDSAGRALWVHLQRPCLVKEPKRRGIPECGSSVVNLNRPYKHSNFEADKDKRIKDFFPRKSLKASARIVR